MKHGRCPTCQTNYRRRFAQGGSIILACRCNDVEVARTTPRAHVLAARFDDQEKAVIEEKAAGRPLSHFIRERLLA